jgi:hypothetical protein
MTVFTKRNAMIGWTTWMVSKQIFKGKAGRAGGRSKKSIAAATAALAAVAGVVFFWRSRQGHGEQLIGPVEPGEQVEPPVEQPTSA